MAEHFNTVPFTFLYCWNVHGTRISAHTLVPGGSSGGGANERVAKVVVRYEDHSVLVDILRLHVTGAEPISATDVAT